MDKKININFKSFLFILFNLRIKKKDNNINSSKNDIFY